MKQIILTLLLVVMLLTVWTESNAKQLISGYTRSNGLETGSISSEILKKYTDFMVLAFYPKAAGNLQVTEYKTITFNGANSLENQVKLYVNGIGKTMSKTSCYSRFGYL